MATINDYNKKAKVQGFCLTKFLDSNESSELRKIKDPTLKIFWSISRHCLNPARKTECRNPL